MQLLARILLLIQVGFHVFVALGEVAWLLCCLGLAVVIVNSLSERGQKLVLEERACLLILRFIIILGLFVERETSRILAL